MATKTTKRAPLAALAARLAMPPPRMVPGQPPPWSLDECLQHIESMGKRVSDMVEFMCRSDSLAGMSGEAKERAVRAFYQKFVHLENELRAIHDDFKLE